MSPSAGLGHGDNAVLGDLEVSKLEGRDFGTSIPKTK